MYKLNINKSMGVATNLIVGRVQDLPYEKFSFKVYDKTEIIDLTGAIIEFRGVNAIGGKIVQLDVKITNAKAGEFEFEVPEVFYSTMGKFTNAYFLIKREGRADSTEDLLINVLSGTEVSDEDAQIVIDGLDKVIEDTIEKVSKDLLIKIDQQLVDMNAKITKLDGDVKRIDKVVKDAEVKMNKLVVDTTANIEQLKKDFEAKLTQLDLKIVDFDKSIVAFEKRLQDLTALIDSKNLITQEDIDRMGFVTNTQLISKRYVSESQLTSKNYVNNQELINMRFVKHSEMGNLLHNYPTTGFLRKNPVNDLNELKESGLFTFDVATKNVPTTGFLTVTCKMRNNTSGSQIAESIGEVGTSKLWNRAIVNGTWSNWEPLHTPDVATTSSNGLMSSKDKASLDNLSYDTGWLKLAFESGYTEFYSCNVKYKSGRVSFKGAFDTTKGKGVVAKLPSSIPKVDDVRSFVVPQRSSLGEMAVIYVRPQHDIEVVSLGSTSKSVFLDFEYDI